MLTRFRAYLEDRTGLPQLARAALDRPIPGGAGLARAFGWALALLFVVEFATGAALATAYAPSAQTAWASVFYLEQHFRWGPLVRGIHFWAGQAMVVVLALHLYQVVLWGAYRAPRELNWWLGLGLGGVVFGLVHTGALLPWDEQAYWTTRVEAGIAASVPPAGAAMQRLLQGGRDVGSLTLTRMYALHVALLPLLGAALVLAHAALALRAGAAPPPWAATGDAPGRAARAARRWPEQAAVDALFGLAVVGLVVYLARRFGAPLGAPADPQGDFPARPEWYLLWLFRLRKYFEGPTEVVATVVLPGAAAALLAALPLLDRARSPALAARAPWVGLVTALGAAVVALTLLAVRQDARDPAVRRGREAAAQRAARARALAAAGVPPEGPLEMLRNDPRVRPAQLFAQHCGNCHAPPGAPLRDAQGRRTDARAPTLAGFGSRAWALALLTNPDADDLFGRTDIHGMPPQAQRLGPEGMEAVSEYLYAQSVEPGDRPADAALAERGAQVFHQRCTVCHQGPGDLSETPCEERTAPDLTGWASREWLRDQILHPEAPSHYGADNRMPGFADELRGRELEWVIDYVRALRAQPAPAPQPPRPDAAPREG